MINTIADYVDGKAIQENRPLNFIRTKSDNEDVYGPKFVK
jgi:hypothetical protein